MAQLNFPDNPINGQLYPNPCPTGVTQYKWDSSTGMWRIVGVATGVTPGQYGDDLTVGQFTIDVAGNVTQAANIPIRAASTTSPGVAQLNNTTTSISITQALTAAAGKNLQDQIGNLANCTVPDHTNVVAALNDLQAQAAQLQEGALIWCGYYNALQGDISYVSITGQKLGYVIGQELPVASSKNGGDMFIVTVAGNPYIAGDYNAPDQQLEVGNWVVSEVTRWSEVNSTSYLTASDIKFVPTGPLTATNVQNALYQVTQLFRTGIGGATISETKPANPYPGQLWWDSDDGIFYIYYVDQNSQQWVETGGAGGAGLQQSGGGTVYEIRTGVGLTGGPITTDGEISLEPAYVGTTLAQSVIGGVIPNLGFDYSNTTGALNLKISSDPTGKDPYTAFSQEGASVLNAKIDSLSGQNVLAGTYDAAKGELVYVTPAGALKGFVTGQNLPSPSSAIDNYYVIVTIGGDVGPGGAQRSGPGDWYICQADSPPAVWVLIDYAAEAYQAVNIAVTPIPGIEFASNTQRALEAIELQAQDRIEFCESTTDGLQISVSQPSPTDNDGTTLSIGLDYASINDRGIVQLTNDISGNSETLAVTQFGINALNAKVDALVGANVLAGTYNANTGVLVSVTPAGSAAGFVVGQNAPAPASVPDNYYLIVIVGGGFGPPTAVIPPTGVQSGDWFIAEREAGQAAQWVTIDYENRQSSAVNVDLAPVPGLSATNVQSGIEQIQEEVEQTISALTSANDGITVALTPNNADFGYGARLTLNPATSTDIGGVFIAPNNGLFVSPAGGLALAPPTQTAIGGVKAGRNITIDPDGTINSSGGGGGEAQVEILSDISSQFNGSLASFQLTVGGTRLPPTVTISRLFISVGGINQTPNSAFSWDAVNSTINFTSPPPPGATFDGRVIITLPGESAANSDPVGVSLIGSFDGSNTSFRMVDYEGQAVRPVNDFSIMVSIGGVVQKARLAYSVSGDSLNFTEPPPAGIEFYGVCYSQG